MREIEYFTHVNKFADFSNVIDTHSRPDRTLCNLNFSLNKKFARGICQNALLEGILIKWPKGRKNSGNLVSGGKRVEFVWVVSCI